MGRKKLDVNERQQNRDWEALKRSPLLNKKYPKVTDVNIEMSYEDPDGLCNFNPEQRKYSQKDKAFFNIKCPSVECVSGGFDLSLEVDKLVSSHLDKLEGTVLCQGWLDKERINRSRCWLKLDYTISAKYKDGD